MCIRDRRYIGEAYENKNFTFKVVARRGNKQYPVVSDQINRDLGEVILNAYPETRVDVHNPVSYTHLGSCGRSQPGP